LLALAVSLGLLLPLFKPIEKVVREVSIPDNIKVSDLAQKMATKAGEVLKVLSHAALVLLGFFG
jgi:hypothetical protein